MHTPKNSERGKLLDQYVLLRITDMKGINIGLFDYDRHNALYYFILNADEEIYLRYGGRDETSPEAYLNFDSMQIALERGLELHRAKSPPNVDPRPEPRYPRDIPLIQQEVIAWGRCVECHLIADYDLIEKEFDGTLDKLKDMFRYPDIRSIGIELNKPRGLVIAKAKGPVAGAGVKRGDEIVALEGVPVYTFADLQYRLDKVDKDADSLVLSVARNSEVLDKTVALPKEWWWTDLYHRYLTVDPNPYFTSRPLTEDEKRAMDLPLDGFAAEVDALDPAAQVYVLHDLQVGDVIYSVDGIESSPDTQRLDLFIKLHAESGLPFEAGVIRDGVRSTMKIGTFREHFRKPEL